MKIGAGIVNKELFTAADAYGVTAVGGLCTTVGAGGGYFAGGGHSPMTSLLGLGADQVRASQRKAFLFFLTRAPRGLRYSVLMSSRLTVAL